MNQNRLVSLLCAISAALLWTHTSLVHAQFPVFDSVNHSESVKHTEQLQQQYKTALDQYNALLDQLKIMERNSKPLSQQADTDVQNKIESMLSESEVHDKNNPKVRSISYYQRSCVAKGTKCTDAEIAELDNQRGEMLNQELHAQEANLRALRKTRDQARTDASLLQTIERNAATANGLLEAIQYNNQLAAMNAAQLMQLRLLIAAQNRVATSQEQRLTDESSQHEAAHRELRPKKNRSTR